MSEYINELRPELVGIHAINFGIAHNSPSRSQMTGSHLSQKLVIQGSEPSRTQTGAEQEFGKSTFAVKMPANGRIIQVIERYPRGVSEGSLNFNPETLVIFEHEDTKQIDCFTIPYHSSYHQFFGYKNEMKDGISKLVPHAYISKGTVFCDTPANKNGNYTFGINLNTALMSVPGVAEDGIIIARDVLPKLRFNIYETRTADFGSKSYPRFIYGNMPFPDIGEYVRSDGLLMAFRTYDEDLAPVEMGINDIHNVDYTFDRCLYAREEQVYVDEQGVSHTKRGRIVDIKVIANNEVSRKLPKQIAAPFEKYAKAYRQYYLNLLALEQRLSYERKKKFGDGTLNISPMLQGLLVEARAITNHQSRDLKGTLGLIHRRAPLDEYSIQFTIEYEITPNIGFKLSGLDGDTISVKLKVKLTFVTYLQ